MPKVLLVVLVLDALLFVFLAFGAIAQPRQPDGIGEGLMWVMLLVAGIPLALALLLWFVGLPRVATIAGLLPFIAAGGWRFLEWRSTRQYAETKAGADLFPDKSSRAIARAIAENDSVKLRALKAEGANFNARGEGDDTILTFAIFYWPDRVPLLLELGADPNFNAGPGTGPVYFACVNGKSDAVAALLRAGGKPDVTDRDGTPVIFHTLKGNDTRAFGYLIDAGADVTGRDDRGYTLLMATAWHRKWREASVLLARGIDPRAVGKFGDSLESIMREMHLEPEDLADPGYRAFVEALNQRGLVVTPRAG